MVLKVPVFATVLFGIVPATLELLVNAILAASFSVPEGVVVRVHWASVPLWLLTWLAVLVGYVALIFAAAGRVGRLGAFALIVGALAMAYAAVSGTATYLLLPSAVVALAHAVVHFVGHRKRTVQQGASDAA